jgi:hypothetical protein
MELAKIQTSAITRILAPLGSVPDRQAASQMVLTNMARELLSPQLVRQVDERTIRVDAFTQLKMQILNSSAAGNLELKDQINAMMRQQLSTGRTNLLEQLRSPFLQPHESNFSGAQQLGRLAYFAEDRSLLTRADGSNKMLQLSGPYQHGGGGVERGSVVIPISAQTPSNRVFSSQFHDSQLEATGKDTVSFFDLKTLFDGSRQLNTTTLAELGDSLGGYQDKDAWLTQLQQQLGLANNQTSILITPYVKAEQIQQRLKNLTGTRPAIEYALDFYKDILSQKDLSKYYHSTAEGELSYLNRGAAVAANLNVTMPKIQYAYALAKQAELEGTGRSLTDALRATEANPLSELRGFATNQKLKRLLIATSVNQTSDYMHLNSAHEAYYGYEQYTKVEIEGVKNYDAAGGKIHSTNIGVDLQRQVLQTAFEPGRAIYYSETLLTHSATVNMLTHAYNQELGNFTNKSLALMSPEERKQILADKNVRKGIAGTLQERFGYLGKVTYDKPTGNISFSLKAGLYGFDQNKLTNYGLFDGDTPRLLLGLAPTLNEQGQFVGSQQIAVKISGLLRRDQQGVAVTNNLLTFDNIDGRMVGHAGYTILFDGSVRPGIENVKGPGRYDDSALFDYYAKKYDQLDYAYSARTLTDNNIYGIASAASLKGFNYESGLDVLSTQASKAKFTAKLQQNKQTSTALLAAYFVDDLSSLLGKEASASDKAGLQKLSQDLRTSILQRLGEDSQYGAELAAVETMFKSKKGLASNINLFVNNSGLFNLLDRDRASYGLGVKAPLAQLQQTLLTALQSGDDRVLNRVMSIFDKAAADSPLVNEGYRVFDQSSGNVRAASVLSNVLGLTYQTLDYAQQRKAQAPLAKSILELNLLDPKTGRISNELLFGERSAATVDLLTRAKVVMPREEVMNKFRQHYAKSVATGQEFYTNNKSEYNRLIENVANVYAAAQQGIPLQMAVYIAPSKILQAAGSKDSANLEYHYSIAMSKRQIDSMRGYVSDPNELTEVAAAYRMLVKFTQSKTVDHLKFISPFLGSEQVANHRVAVKSLEYAGTLGQDLTSFGPGRNRNLFTEYAQYAIAGDAEGMRRVTTGLETLDAVAKAYLGTAEEQLTQRAIALSTASDTRRGRLVQEQAARQNAVPKSLVFFDIETAGLVDNRYPQGDARRSPTKSINELTFIFGTGADAEVVSWRANDPDGKNKYKSRAAALQEVGRLLNGKYKDAALVGHNVRLFDIPTLNPLMPDVDLTQRQVIDTLHDVDRIGIKATLGTNKFNLGVAYKEVERLRLQGLPNDPVAQAQLRDGTYGIFKAHDAEFDVRANIEVFKFLTEQNLFKQRQSPVSVAAIGAGRLLENGSIIYYDAANKSKLSTSAIELAGLIHRSAKTSHLGYHYQKNIAEYRQQAAELASKQGLNGDIVLSYAEELLFKGMNQAGRLPLGKGIAGSPEEIQAYLYRVAIESDAKIRTAVGNTLKSNAGTYIDNITNQALAFRDQEVMLRVKGDIAGADKAKALYSSLYESRVLLMPDLAVSKRNNQGNYGAHLVGAKPDAQGNQRAMLGQSLIYLGADILQHLPKEFGEFVPQIINHRRELDRLLPQYYDIVESLQTGTKEITEHQRTLILDLQGLAIRNKELVYQALGGALAQRAFGERTKVRGISGTTVASYLLQIDQVGLGSRFTNVLNQKQLRRIAKAQGLEVVDNEVLLLRAGGPAGASQLDQTYRVQTISQMAAAADAMGTYTKLDPKRNQTTSLIPIYGRFSSQGGDFDGDSYGIISKYDQELKVYADLLEENKKLKDVQHSLKRQIKGSREAAVTSYATREYDKLLTAELDRNAIHEAKITNLQTQLDNALATGEIDNRKMFKSIYNILGGEQSGSKKQFFNNLVTQFQTAAADAGVTRITPALITKWFNHTAVKQAKALLAAQGLAQPTGGAQDFMAGIAGKTTPELETEYLRQRQNQPAGVADAEIAQMQAQAKAKASAAYHKGVVEGRYQDLPADEIEFIQQQLGQVKDQRQALKGQIAEKGLALAPLLQQTEGVAEKSVAAMRRHTAAYTGLPMSALSKEAGIFSDAAVFNMIEQHAGVTPGLQDVSPKVAAAGEFNARLITTLADLNESYVKANARGVNLTQQQTALAKSNPRLALSMLQQNPAQSALINISANYAMAKVGAEIETKIQNLPDTKIGNAIKATVAEVGLDVFLGYSTTERINKVSLFAGQQDAVAQAMMEINTITSKAAGTALSDTAFHALQDTVGSTATNLIGEAYNAITLTMSKAVVARSMSEALSSHLLVATGIESNGGEQFLETTKASFIKTFASGTTWDGNPDSDKLDQARDLVMQVFDRPADLAKSAFDRSQALTGSLANVQQSIRDSLKQKVDGGLLQTIMSEPVVGSNSMYDILTSDSGDQNERVAALRKFLGEDASQSIFNLPKERGYSERYKITAFGSLFLLSDYLQLKDNSAAERMIGLTSSVKHDENQVESYNFLKERYETMSIKAQASGDARAATMLSADNFIAQSVVELMAMSSAERSVTQAAFKGDAAANPSFIDEMVKLRQHAMVAYGSKNTYGFDSQAVSLAKADYFGADPGAKRSQYQRDIATALFFDADTGADLLKTDQQRLAAAQTLGLSDQISNNLTDVKDDGYKNSFYNAQNQFDFYQRAIINYTYTRNLEFGPSVQDIQEMGETSRAVKYLRFESVEGNTTFSSFVKASASAIDALATVSMNHQIEDAHQMAAVSYEAGMQLVTAFGDVQSQLEATYGKLDFSKDNATVPLETMRAYHSAQTLSGIFTKLFDGQTDDPTVQKYATEMFAISLATKNAQGNSGYQDLAHFLGGMAQMSKTHHAMQHASEQGISAEMQEMHDAYNKAKGADEIAGNRNYKNSSAVAFLTQLGKDNAPDAAPTTILDAQHHSNQTKKQGRTNLIGALIGPALMTAFSATEGDANLIQNSIGAVQAVAQVVEQHRPNGWTAARLFQVDRIQNSLRAEGAVIGGLKAVTSELMFEATARFAHQALGSNQGKASRNYLAEAGIAAFSLMVASGFSGREYGARGESQDTAVQQAFISLPGMGVGIAAHAIEEFMQSNTVESDVDTQVEYEVSLSTSENSLQQAFASNWYSNTDTDLSNDERSDGSAMDYNYGEGLG